MISQVEIENPTDLNTSADVAEGHRRVGTRKFSSTAFGIFFDRVGIAEGICKGRLFVSSRVSSLFGSDFDILSIFGSASGVFVVYERIYCT